jgi:DNA-binding transcriptional ArsR family regulator
MVNWRVDNVMSGDIGLFGSLTGLGRLKEAPDERTKEARTCCIVRIYANIGNLATIGYISFMRVPLHPAKNQISLPNVLFALSDPTRLRIVKAIAEHDKINCCEIEIDLSKSTASRHFRVLREAGIIRMEPRGVVCINSLRRQELEELFPGLLDSVLEAMEPARPRARLASKTA